MLRKLSGIVLGIISLVVAVHFIATPIYEDAVDIGQVWDVMNWFMALGVVAAVVVHYLRKRGMDGRGSDAITREYLEVNLALYVSVFLALWFFWNWFDNFAVGAELQSQTRRIVWAFINPMFVMVVGFTACHLVCVPFRKRAEP